MFLFHHTKNKTKDKKPPGLPAEDELRLRRALAQKLAALGGEPPASLSPAAVTARLSASQSRRPQPHRHTARTAALAASFLLVAGAVTVIALNAQPPKSVAPVKSAAGYGQIEDAVRTILKRTGSAANGGEKYNALAQAAPAAGNAATDSLVSGGGDYTATNIQVAGVDEADILKNDGKYLYGIVNNLVTITDASDPGQMKLLKQLAYDANTSPVGLFVSGSRMAVILQVYSPQTAQSTTVNAPMIDIAYAPNARTVVVFYDISTPASPREVRRFTQDGSYLSARLTAGSLYLATSYHPPVSRDSVTDDRAIPHCGTGDDVRLLAAADIAIAEDPAAVSYSIVSGMSLADDAAPVSTKAVLGGGGTVYASASNLYVASPRWNGDGASGSSDTTILRYSLNKGTVESTGSARVPGTPINQFSMDEYDGRLRIATTVRRFATVSTADKGGNATVYSQTTDVSNSVYVLDLSMQIAGRVENIAPGESIQSVRFLGTKAYVVTYKNTDPLFALDLADPAAPKILGELTMPGFSSYLEPWSDTLLIGIGQEQAASGKSSTLKLSLYDVSDPLHPKETAKYLVPGDYAYSQAMNDHHALLVSKEKGLVGLPMTSSVTDAKANVITVESSYLLMGVDPQKGFTLLSQLHQPSGRIDSPNSPKQLIGTDILRGTLIGNTLFTLSSAQWMATSLAGYGTLGLLALPQPQAPAPSSAPGATAKSDGGAAAGKTAAASAAVTTPGSAPTK